MPGGRRMLFLQSEVTQCTILIIIACNSEMQEQILNKAKCTVEV